MTAIQVENLSKAYQLGQIGTGTISRDLERFWTTKILGKEDLFLKIGQTNDRTSKGSSDIVWSLKDINFSIEQGDAVGIIGRNGAGKSTLLKLLSRVTSPTTGSIKVKGRIASLLEVGTGFHPELSGRENIFLNGAILGMRKAEIKRKFDEIVDFAGVERYIDTPVKRYSSGMYVRLAFAVAAHLESEILIVDEVLAVGDAEFQKKCLGKMGDISKGEGRTVLFVSHNMAAVNELCRNSIVLNKGMVDFIGNSLESINFYSNIKEFISIKENKFIKINNFQLLIQNNNINLIEINTPFIIKGNITFITHLPTDIKIEIFINDDKNQVVSTLSTWLNSINISPSTNELEFNCEVLNGLNFKDGEYSIDLKIIDSNVNLFENIYIFELVNNSSKTGYIFPLKPHVHGNIYTSNKWNILSK
jgi:lipopolysaccharide transport system ATP-binding protein